MCLFLQYIYLNFTHKYMTYMNEIFVIEFYGCNILKYLLSYISIFLRTLLK